MKDIVMIRIYRESRDRLKVRAAVERKNMMQLIDSISLEK